MDTDLVTLQDASRSCGVSLATMNHWVRRSGVRLVRAAGEKWIKRSFLAGFMRRRDLAVPFELERWPRIMIVEDEKILRLRMEQHMRDWWSGSEILGTDNNERVLEMLSVYRPDLAVMDMSLPGMGRLTLCRELARQPALAHTKLLIVADSMGPESPTPSFAEGSAEFLPKPFEAGALRAAAQRLLGKSP